MSKSNRTGPIPTMQSRTGAHASVTGQHPPVDAQARSGNMQTLTQAQSAVTPLTRPVMTIKGTPVSVVDMLRGMRSEKASDMFLQTGAPVRLKLRGQVKTMETPPLSRAIVNHVMSCFLSPEEIKTLHRRRTADVVHQDGAERYRVHFAFGHTGPYTAIRLIGADILELSQLALPEVVQRRLETMRSGLLIVAGATDSGKTVTSTALLEHINANHDQAILTLEDPIEHVFAPKRSMIIQKEVGLHAASFSEGIRSALRENLDVIFVGEMRERDTIEQVLRAGETGHLVVTTVHSDDALSAILRIVGTYTPDDQPRIRQSLAATLAGVLFQRLLPRRGQEGRVPCVETLWANTAVRAIVRSGDMSKLGSYVGRATGGLGYRECLTDLHSFNEIDEDVFHQEIRRLQA